MSKQKGEKGAPKCALKAIEEHEVQCRHEKDVARDLWKAAADQLCRGR